MNEFIEKLTDYGADIKGVTERFLGDKELYATCFDCFLQDEAFDALQHAIKEQDYQKAFDCAHTLKGVAANLGLGPMVKEICNMVETLRNNNYDNLQQLYKNIIDEKEKLAGIK